MTDVIEFVNVSKSFRGVKAVNNLSFSVMEGEIFGFVGPNGAGKTTTVRLILGLLKPNKGSIYVFNKDISRDKSFRWRIGCVLEKPGLYEDLSAYENLELYAKIFKIPEDRIKERIIEVLGIVGLEDWKDKAVGVFSKGMKQRLVIARALLHEPELYIFDEVSSSLDPKGQIVVRGLIKDIADQGKTVFLTSHNLYEVEELCDRIGIISKGRLIASGKIRDLERSLNSSTFRVGSPVFVLKSLPFTPRKSPTSRSLKREYTLSPTSSWRM